MKKLLKKSEDEKGQAMVEFVLVLPIFLLILFLIVDMGWLFYNYVSVENAARNAARVACVEYDNVNYTFDEAAQKRYPEAECVYYTDEAHMEEYGDVALRLIKEVDNSLVASSINVESITVTYTADLDVDPGDMPEFFDRPNGDVIVKVKCNIPVFTPVLGVKSDHMRFTVSSSSTYMVERKAQDGLLQGQ